MKIISIHILCTCMYKCTITQKLVYFIIITYFVYCHWLQLIPDMYIYVLLNHTCTIRNMASTYQETSGEELSQ